MVDINNGNPLGPDVSGDELNIENQAAGDVLYYNGTAWVRLAKGTALQALIMNSGATAPEWGNAGALALVEEQTTGGAATSITSGTLDLDSHECYLIMVHLGNSNAAASSHTLVLNSDTTTSNYDYQKNNINSSTYTAASGAHHYVNSSTGVPQNGSAWMVILLKPCPIIAATFAKCHTVIVDSAGGTPVIEESFISWNSSANVTSVAITSNRTNGIPAGAVMQIWKVTS